MSTPEVMRADPRTKRLALGIVVGGLLVGGAIIGWGVPWLERWAVDASMSGNLAARRWLCIGAGAAILALGLGVVVSGLNMVHIGRRVLAEGRFPPAGLRVMLDTPVRTGHGVRAIGRVQQALGGAIVAAALVLVALGAYVVIMLWP